MPQRARRVVAAVIAALLIFCGHAAAEDRVALVIGNSNYHSIPPLLTPATDAKAFADLLTAADFQVVWGADVAQIDLRRAIRDFSATVVEKGPDTVALIFYAGYGIQVDGENFLIPVDARIERQSDVAVEALRLTDVLNAISAPPAKARIVILDAAHSNPFKLNQSDGKGMAIVDPPAASIVAFSAAPGTEGADRPFTATLITAAKAPGLSIDDALKLVRVATFEASSGTQLSWETSSLTTGFALFPGAMPMPAPDRQIKSAEFWQKEIQSRQAVDAFRFIVSQDATAGYEALLRAYPNLNYAPQIRAFLDRRQEMMAWHDTVKANSAVALETFLARYPRSDLLPATRRLLARAHENSAGSGPATALLPPPAIAPAAAATSTPEIAPKKKAEPEAKKKRARSASDDDNDRPRRRQSVTRRRAASGDTPQPRSELPILVSPVGIGIGGFGIGIGR
jgi:uncharacterized caspase-like protein